MKFSSIHITTSTLTSPTTVIIIMHTYIYIYIHNMASASGTPCADVMRAYKKACELTYVSACLCYMIMSQWDLGYIAYPAISPFPTISAVNNSASLSTLRFMPYLVLWCIESLIRSLIGDSCNDVIFFFIMVAAASGYLLLVNVSGETRLSGVEANVEGREPRV